MCAQRAALFAKKTRQTAFSWDNLKLPKKCAFFLLKYTFRLPLNLKFDGFFGQSIFCETSNSEALSKRFSLKARPWKIFKENLLKNAPEFEFGQKMDCPGSTTFLFDPGHFVCRWIHGDRPCDFKISWTTRRKNDQGALAQKSEEPELSGPQKNRSILAVTAGDSL